MIEKMQKMSKNHEKSEKKAKKSAIFSKKRLTRYGFSFRMDTYLMKNEFNTMETI